VFIKCEALTVVNIKITVFWFVTLCSLVDVRISDKPAVYVFRVEEFYPENGRSNFLSLLSLDKLLMKLNAFFCNGWFV
jgi:hypothetical protein